MTLRSLAVCEVTRLRLGDEGLADLAACLWPVDCQSCGGFLGDDPPSVLVDDLGGRAMASLHHQGCRAPGWNDSMIVITGSGQFTTFVARMVLLPVVRADGIKGTCPLMVVNPGLECVQLQHALDGSWRAGEQHGLAGVGLVRPGPALRLCVPADGLVARITDSCVVVVLQVPPFTVYEAPANRQLLDRARALGGVLIAVTQTLNPGDFAVSDLSAMLAHPRTAAGWAALHGISRPPRRRFRRRGEICVLHWSREHLSVGKLVGQAPRRLSDDQARSWAESVISRRQAEPLTWRPVPEESPDGSWSARGFCSAQQHVLRRHADGWKLVLICAETSGTRAETDNEAKAWAAEMLKLHAGITGLAWQPRPSTPGSVTLHGTPRRTWGR
jgi:hypothetical protein